ncbi:MAG: hypothetical protein A3J42_03820 [Candidatus Dadabacteria bacterium RIFCSPHIGHO2_12_FULL_53_21]|nr:MAG: hypothetical protein A3J42_03820 [Candidatus Dadabacteria bacterium RIFCSPHIGHO2_12_FULL_53_21]
MNSVTKYLPLMIFLLVTLAFRHLEANAQTYLPVGPQTNVPVDAVTGGGWTECYRDTYNIAMDANTVLSSCPGELLMLSCRPTGSDTLTLLAQGLRSDVTFDTGVNSNLVHDANGVGWYFNNTGDGKFGQSWGFIREGDSINKNNCDVANVDANDERLCWHLNGDNGYRCGATQNIFDDSYERIVYTGRGERAIPTLSEWGLIAMAGLMGIVGFIVIRRRKVAA